MALNKINNSNTLNDDIIDIKKQSLYARLKTLFSSDTIVRNIGGKQLIVKDTDHSMMAGDRNSLRDRFNRIRSTAYNAYSRDFSLSYQAARIEMFRDYQTMDMDPILCATLDIVADECVGGNTIIPLPDGTNPTIAELAEKYKNKPQERFYVWSYDREANVTKLGNAFNPRSKGIQKVYKVTFEEGKYIIATDNHLFLMRNGEYKPLKELKIKDSIMPFYQHNYGYNKHNFKQYRKIYNFSKGWQSEHKIIAEQFNRPMKSNEVVHHKNFDGSNNLPDNLLIMDWDEHKKFHSNHNKNILWGAKNYDNQLKKLTTNLNYINRKFHHWNGERSGLDNPFYGKHHTEESNKLRSDSLKICCETRDYSENKNPNYREDLSIESLKEKAVEYYRSNEKLNIWGFNKYVGCDYSTIQNRLTSNNLTWNLFKSNVISTLNHKIQSIEYVGEQEVFDISVDKYNNFATDTCFVHNCLTTNEMGKMLTVHCENNNVKEILENLYDDILNIDFNLWGWLRNTLKLGDHFLKVYVSPEYGVYMVEPINAENVERIENSDPYNKKYVKFQIRPTDTSQAEVLENWQICHFRLAGDTNFFPYGRSYLEGARRIWKQLSLLEDAMMIHRVVRAPERRIFYVDIGNIPPTEVDNYMQKLQDKIKKVPYMNERGEYNLKFNLQNMLDDFYIPTRGSDSGTRIDTLPGMDWTGIDDVEYLKNKMFAALKIPKTFLNFGEEGGSKATLSNEDIRFARTIQRIQKLICSELEKIGIIHLYAQGYRDESLIDFKIELTNSSTIFEKEKLEILSNKTTLAADMLETGLFSPEHIYKQIFHMSNDDIETEKKAVIEYYKRKYRLTSIETEGDDPAMPFKKIGAGGKGKDGGDSGGLGGSGGGGLGGLGGGLGDLGGSPGDDEGENGEDNKPDKEGNPPENQEDTNDKKEEKPEDIVKEEADRDQTGEHKASSHPFGEDPTGQLELNRKPNKHSEFKKKSELHQNFEGDSPYSLEEYQRPINHKNKMKSRLILSLSEFFNDKPINIKKELIKESTTPSMLDESNIKEII